jgi:hypothetical protein
MSKYTLKIEVCFVVAFSCTKNDYIRIPLFDIILD